MCDDAEVARPLRDHFPHPYTRADADAWIGMVTAATADGSPACHLAIVDAADRVVGGIGVQTFTDNKSHVVELGYYLGRAHWGRGLASAAVALMVAHVFAHFPRVERIEAQPNAANAASRRVLEKNGFSLEGTLRKAFRKHNVMHDVAIYGLLRSDPQPAAPAT